MKKSFLYDLLQITILYLVFGILVVVFDDVIPGVLVILFGYIVSIAIIFLLERQKNKKQTKLNELIKKYEKILPPEKWTEVYLKPGTHEKLGITYTSDASTGIFFAKLNIVEEDSLGGTVWTPYVLVATIDEGEIITSKTHTITYPLSEFQEKFML